MSANRLASMSNTAFAGLLRLLLTPLNETPPPSDELRAYLQHLSDVAPGLIRSRGERQASKWSARGAEPIH